MNQLLKLPVVCSVLLLTANTCFAQFSDDKAWGSFNGKIDSVTINGFAVGKDGTGKAGQSKSKIVLAYNDNGKLTHQDAYIVSPKQSDSPDHLMMGITNSYDESGQINGTIFSNSNNKAFCKEVYTVNKTADLLETKRYGIPGNVLIEMVKIQLDKNGNMLSRSTRDTTSKLLSEFTFKYNGIGQRVEESEFGLSIKPNTKRWLNMYNADGNVVKQVYYAGADRDASTDTITYTYTKFDSKHNWLLRNVYLKGKLTGIAERTILYYKD
jgi:hypothetical protein